MKSQQELKTMAEGLINPIAKEMLGKDNYEYVVNMMVNFGIVMQQLDEKPSSLEMLAVLESLNNPTTWFDVELHSCCYCRAHNPGLIQHTPNCKITRLREVIAKAKEEENLQMDTKLR
jgi:hypothetical protein